MVSVSARAIRINGGNVAQRAVIDEVFAKYGRRATTLIADVDVAIRVLADNEKYSEASPTLYGHERDGSEHVAQALAIASGVFVVDERRLYLKNVTPMTVAHETGHMLDYAAGGGKYRSGIDPAIREAYKTAPGYVTPYAASGRDEWFAECCRAYIGVNDADCLWMPVSRRMLLERDPVMHDIVARIIEGP